MGNQIQDKIIGVLNKTKDETVQREEIQESVIELLQQTITRARQELEVEKRERNESQEAILTLLEKQCSVLGTQAAQGSVNALRESIHLKRHSLAENPNNEN